MYAFVRHTLAIPLYALAVATLIPAALCQTITTGEITGTVADPADRVVIAATVHLRNIDTGESRAVQSNGSGVYRFVFVKPGAYEISGRAAGLQSDAGSLIVAVGQVQRLDLHLKLEQSKSVVLVTDGAPLLNTENAHFVYTLSTQQLNLLPLPGGDLASVAYSAPGAVINNNRFGEGNVVFQGVGSVSNLFTVNGADAMNPYLNTQSLGVTNMLLGINEVKEASVVQNAFEGQYGRQAGAQISYVTKSGANTFHGNLVYGYNGTRLNANDFFANATNTPRPLAISNQYAASLGGPLVRNRLFFFVDTEGLHYTLPTPNRVAGMPSPELQSYALRMIKPSQVPLYEKMFRLYNDAPGHERAVPVSSGTGIFRNNMLGCGTLAGTPTGTGGVFGVDIPCAHAWLTNTSAATKEWLLSVRVDYNLSANQRIFFRFRTDHGTSPSFNSDVNPIFSSFNQGREYQGQVSHTIAITPHLVNHFIGSVTHNTKGTAAGDMSALLDAFPLRINIQNGGFLSSIGGDPNVPAGLRIGQLQLVDDISYSVGRHSLKAGVNYRYNPTTDFTNSFLTQFGRYNLRSMNDFASGLVTGNSFYSRNFAANPTLGVRLYNLGAYLQDQWALTPTLRIMGAVRLDRTGNPHCRGGCYSRLVALFQGLQKGLSIPYNQSIQTGASEAFYDIEPIVVQPRLSLVYAPQWLRSTVFRGGIGLFYDLYASEFASFLGRNPPGVFLPNIRAGIVDVNGTGSSAAIAAASADAFVKGFASGATLPQLQQAVAPAAFGAPAFDSMPSKAFGPKSLQWILEMQRQLGEYSVLTIRYAGNHGYDIFMKNPNANASADPDVYPNGFPGVPSVTPDPRFAGITQYSNQGYSNYHGLTTNFRRTFRSGLQGQVSYTWSHALDTISNGGLVSFAPGQVDGQVSPDSRRSLNYGSADYDVRHNLTADLIWNMPFRLRSQLANAVLSGWSTGFRLNAHTGTPFSVSNQNLGGLVNFTGSVLAVLLDPKIRTTCGQSAIDAPCFRASQFVPYDEQADLGNLPRNSFRGPGHFNLDASLFKSVPLGEGVRLMIGASAYNALNHPNFARPGQDISDSSLGLITGTVVNPSGPFGSARSGLSGRIVVVTGKLMF